MSIVTTDKNDRVMFFVDIRNVINGCRETTGTDRIEYTRMVDHLADGRRVTGAYIFDGEEESKLLHNVLAYQGFRVVTRDSGDYDEKVQKEVDVALACELIRQTMSDSFDVAIVVSGDRDFLAAIEMVQSCGKRVEVAAFERCLSKRMMRGCDAFTFLDSLPIVILDSERETEEAEDNGTSSEKPEAEAF